MEVAPMQCTVKLEKISGGGAIISSNRSIRDSELSLARNEFKAWLPDGYSQIFRAYVFGPLGFWTLAPLRYAAKCDPFHLDCAPTPSTLAQSKERKGSNFAIWQPWFKEIILVIQDRDRKLRIPIKHDELVVHRRFAGEGKATLTVKDQGGYCSVMNKRRNSH